LKPLEEKVSSAAVSGPGHAARWGVYVLAVIVTLATLFLRHAMTPWLGERPVLILFVLPIILSAYVGGVGPGLVATALAGMGTEYFVMPPTQSFLIDRPADIVQWLALILAGVLISLLSRDARPVLETWRKDQIAASFRSTVRLVQGGYAFALVTLGIIGLVSYLSIMQSRKDIALMIQGHEVSEEGRVIGNHYLRGPELRAVNSADIAQTVILGGGLFAFVLVGFALFVIRRDLAGRQKAEAELEHFFSLSLDFLCIASVDGYFKRVSPAVADILGWSVEEFLSRPYLDFVHPDDQAAAVQEIEKQVVHGQKVLQFENRARHKDGSWRVLSWRSMPGPDGLMYASARDITDIKRMEQLLRDVNYQLEQRVQERTTELEQSNTMLRNSEIRFRALIEHSGDSIALVNEDNKILYVSPSVASVEGYAPEELIGRSGLEYTHPDDLPLVQDVVRQLMADPGKPIPVLWRRRHKDGHWLWLEGTATNLLGNPAVGAIVTNYRDVTERKLAEQKILEQIEHLDLLDQITRAIGERMDLPSIFQVVVRTLENSLPVDFCCVAMRDASGDGLKIASVGIKSGPLAMELAMTEGGFFEVHDDGLGRCMRGELVYVPDAQQVQSAIPQRLAQGGLSSLVLAPLLSESSVFGVLVAARRTVEGFSSVDCEFLRQVSEHIALGASQAQLHSALRLAYDDLRQTQQAAMQEERLRAVGEMASGIAHDINNALSPVMLYTESLLEREHGLSERARDYLQIIQRAVGDVAQTVTRMREFYRPREPHVELAEVDVNRVVNEVLDLTRPRWSDMAQQDGVVIRPALELEAGLPRIMGVESDMRDALTNLVFNAVDAMPQGGRLTLRTRRAGQPKGGYVVLEIRDEGVGMDEETRRRCLEPFFTTKGERGTGLGLAMVFGMTQRHGADLEIDSAPGAGSTVRLIFAITDTTGAGNGAARTESRTLPPLRLLLVDDDPVLLNSLRNTLEMDGHAIVTAYGGAEGIAAFQDAMARGESFAAVITDLGMPHVDGRKVAAAVKDASADTPVILLTGWGQRLVADNDIPANVNQVLAKPPKLREIRQALERCCGLAV
jgi:PAS domain S-box-containing protein